LARHIGSARQSVIRALRQFENSGVVAGDGDGLLIRDTEALWAHALPGRLGIGHTLKRLRWFWRDAPDAVD
jgi:hypothetical protein